MVLSRLRTLGVTLCQFCLSLMLGLGIYLTPTPVLAADLLGQRSIEVPIALGTQANDLKFVPDRLEFEAGKRYKLVLSNPSQVKHYFTAKDFADGLWTQKVEAGKVEIKGAIHELELKPGATAEWVFVPMKSGTYELHCSIPGHTEAGMRGAIAITSTSSM